MTPRSLIISTFLFGLALGMVLGGYLKERYQHAHPDTVICIDLPQKTPEGNR